MKYLIYLLLVSPILTHAETAKVTVMMPNSEEKVFRFNDEAQLKDLPLNSKWTNCYVSFSPASAEVRYFEVMCSPSENRKTSSRYRSYSVRAACKPQLPALMLLMDDSWDNKDAKKVNTYSIQVLCES